MCGRLSKNGSEDDNENSKKSWGSPNLSQAEDPNDTKLCTKDLAGAERFRGSCVDLGCRRAWFLRVSVNLSPEGSQVHQGQLSRALRQALLYPPCKICLRAVACTIFSPYEADSFLFALARWFANPNHGADKSGVALCCWGRPLPSLPWPLRSWEISLEH